MKRSNLWWHVAVACSVVALAGCGSEGPMGPEGPAGKDGAAGTAGVDGKDGKDGTSCTVTDNGGGKYAIKCGTAEVIVSDGAAGTAGAAGTSCTAKTAQDGVKTVECTDGSKFTIADGAKGADGTSCKAETTTEGVKQVTCTDGSTFVVNDGAKGDTGATGADGTSCTVTDNQNGTKTIKCGEASVLVSDGAKGDKGDTGAQGPVGPSAAQVLNLNAEVPKALTLSVTSVTADPKPVVTFKLVDGTGRGAVGIKSGSSGWIRFGLAKLVPGANGERDLWSSYIRSTSGAGTTERTGTLVDNGDGTYKYTFAVDVTTATNPVTTALIGYDPTASHRLYIQLSGTPTVPALPLPYVNAVYDYRPDGQAVTVRHDVTATASCNECHAKLTIHGSRYEVKYCSLCHNLDLKDTANSQTIDLAFMTHAIHAAGVRTTEYKIGTASFAEVTYPQGLNNCKKCHDAAITATPQGDNWAKFPTKETCGACHDGVVWSSHMGNQADNSKCATCHDETFIREKHFSENNTPNATGVVTGASNFTYEVKDVTMVDDTHPVITFKITRDGVALDPTVAPTDLTGGPSFLLAYALPQDGIDEPGDYNNLGKAAAQPASVSLANLRAGTAGTLAAAADAGYWTATLTGTYAFPAGAKLRAVALQGYFSQTGITGYPTGLGRHTVAAYKAVTGDTVRREVVDSDKCANCHEWFEGHGGNRVRTVGVCVMCHNPNLSTSGRGLADLTKLSDADKALMTAAGYDVTNPLTFPEASNNMKDMIHGIHGSAVRANAFREVRDRGTSGAFYYDFSEVTYPGTEGNCLQCHKPAKPRSGSNPAVPATYTLEFLPGNALWTTELTSDGTDADPAAVRAARTTVPNATDKVSAPVTATCAGCHNSDLALAHYAQNGGVYKASRAGAAATETCILCHGAGRTADVGIVHPVQ